MPKAQIQCSLCSYKANATSESQAELISDFTSAGWHFLQTTTPGTFIPVCPRHDIITDGKDIKPFTLVAEEYNDD